MHNKFLDILDRICERPGMYLTNSSFACVIAYIEGYTRCWIDNDLKNDNKNLFLYFPGWIRVKYKIHHPAWSWARIILHQAGSEDSALKLIPILFREFMKDVVIPDYPDRLASIDYELIKDCCYAPETQTQMDLTFKK